MLNLVIPYGALVSDGRMFARTYNARPVTASGAGREVAGDYGTVRKDLQDTIYVIANTIGESKGVSDIHLQA
jgi:hypothetical protein